jgi:hypothetical protein
VWQSPSSPAPEQGPGSALVAADLAAAARWLGGALATLRSPTPVSGVIARESQSTAPHGGGPGSVTRVVHLRYALPEGVVIQVSTAWDSSGDAPLDPLLQDILVNREYELATHAPGTAASLVAEEPTSAVPLTVDGRLVDFAAVRSSRLPGATLVALGHRDGERRIAIVVPATHLGGITLLSLAGSGDDRA